MELHEAVSIMTEKGYVAIIALTAFAIMLPVLVFGLPYGHDLPHHYQCATTFVEAIRSGDFYPSWSLFRNFGYGGMETRLYPPISHYSLAVVYLIVGNWHIASWLTFTLWAFVGGLGVYLWAREHVQPFQAVFAGCIFILLPYHLNQLYNTFFYAEFVGTSVLPFLFVFTSRVCRRGRAGDVIGLSIAYSVLILTHLPLTVIGSISCAIYGLMLVRKNAVLGQLLKLALGVAGGLAASSFFWVKVVQEKDLMAKAQVYADPWLDYRLNFLLTPIQTYTPGISIEVYNNGTYFYDMMLFYAILMVVGAMLPVIGRRLFAGEKRSLDLWVLLAFSVFISMIPSKFIWDLLPPLQEVQFPWRWLAVVCVVAPVLVSTKIDSLFGSFKTSRRPWALIGCGCILATITFSISQIVRPAPFIEKSTVAQRMEDNAHDIGFVFWWPIWARKQALEIREPVIAENRDVTIDKWQATDREFTIGAGDEPSNVRVATFYHPDWRAFVDGSPQLVERDENGAMLISIPANVSHLKLIFVESNAVRAAQLISILACGLLIVAVIFYRPRRSSLAIR